MKYALYDAQQKLMVPVVNYWNFLGSNLDYLSQYNPLIKSSTSYKYFNASLKWLSNFYKEFPKPSFSINKTFYDGKEVLIEEVIADQKTFCNLIHFKKVGLPEGTQQPVMLIVAPLSGHYATLLRDTVKKTLENFDVYITDWLNPAHIPVDQGDFSFDDYVSYVQSYMQKLSQEYGEKNYHMLAVCQPTVPSLVAIAHAEKHNPKICPFSITVMGGPIDTRQSPTSVNEYAQKHDLNWFKNNVICTVPQTLKGAGRKVYPGFLQHFGFVSMNMKKHTQAHIDFFNHLLQGAELNIDKHRKFYDEYNAVMDLPAPYYLQTLENVFFDQKLAKGTITFKGETVSLQDIKTVKILAVEGEKDDISGRNQTFAVLDLTTNLPENMKTKYLAPKVGHYGVFSGQGWRNDIYPQILNITNKELVNQKTNTRKRKV